MTRTNGHFGARRLALLIGVCLAASLLVGCGKSTCAVNGKVVYDDGKQAGPELEGHVVTFESQNEPVSASGLIGPDGTFTVSTYDMDDGAVPGKHRVAVMAPTPEIDVPPPPREIKAKFESFDKSGLEVTLESGDNDVVLTVERAE